MENNYGSGSRRPKTYAAPDLEQWCAYLLRYVAAFYAKKFSPLLTISVVDPEPTFHFNPIPLDVFPCDSQLKGRIRHRVQIRIYILSHVLMKKKSIADPECLSRTRIRIFIPNPGSKVPDPSSINAQRTFSIFALLGY